VAPVADIALVRSAQKDRADELQTYLAGADARQVIGLPLCAHDVHELNTCRTKFAVGMTPGLGD
jgi:hypothetical protein